VGTFIAPRPSQDCVDSVPALRRPCTASVRPAAQSWHFSRQWEVPEP
jgi:hypothetical protein